MSGVRDYYNEHDPFAAAWLRELIAAGEIPVGDVDERDIQDVQPSDLVGYRHRHWFAGIGGWACAMRIADWPDDVPLWTGSCPCQPFSAAGQGAGFADERHLWPAFHWLIQQCRPRYVCGEQVASADALRWWDLVATDLEGAGYACTAVDLPAASVGAPHKRSRLFWLADAQYEQQHWRWRTWGRRKESANHSTVGLADTSDHGCSGGGRAERVRAATGQPHPCGHQPDGCGDGGEWVGDTRGQGSAEQRRRRRDEPSRLAKASGTDGMGDTSSTGLSQRECDGRLQPGTLGTHTRQAIERGSDISNAVWADCIWLPCTDGKARRAQPGIFPLAHGAPNRVGRLRAYGNAIVPQVAAEFIKATLG